MSVVSIAAARPAPQRTMSPRVARAALIGILALCVFSSAFVVVNQQPVLAIDAARGLYTPEHGGRFRWTSSRAEFPLAPHSGPTVVNMVLSIAQWPRQSQLPVQLATDAGSLATVQVFAQSRHIYALLPPGATLVRLSAPVARAPGDDWRWLGVQLLQITATPTGWPTGAALQALLATVVSVALACGMAWAIRHGLGTVAALTLLGLALRVLWIADAPPIMHRDEVVSLVDAWSLAQTGRDHLGNLLPLAAFEAYGDWLSPMLTYMILPWVALFGPQPIVARLVTAVFGAIAIPCAYGLVRELRLPTAAIWAALVTALSPWEIFLSRVAIQPAMIATAWTLCLWAALRFVHWGRRRDAFGLAAAAGLALYAYPTMKMAVPLLVALAVALALWRHGWRICRSWWLPALLLSLLWLPFASDTFFNAFSRARLQAVGLEADSPGAWLALWWSNYAVYFQPDLYYFSGGLRKIVQGVPDHGMALGAEAALLVGLAGLPLLALAHRHSARHAQPDTAETASAVARVPAQLWLLVFGALLLAPLPASLTMGQPHAFRAATIAPVYAVLVGIGAGIEWLLLGWLPWRLPLLARGVAVVGLVAVLAWQEFGWFTSLVQHYPSKATDTFFFADGELETMQRVAIHAPEFDAIWLDDDSLGRPYIFLLAAQALPPAVEQAEIVVDRRPPHVNLVSRIGPYVFANLSTLQVPQNLPAIEALPTRSGGPGYLLQVWQHNQQRILIVRGMSTHVPNDVELEDTSDTP